MNKRASERVKGWTSTPLSRRHFFGILSGSALALQGRRQAAAAVVEFVKAWGSEGTANGKFQEPRGIAVDDAGRVYVVDGQNNRVQKFTSNGTFLTEWGSYGSSNGKFKSPSGLAVDDDGNVYVVDGENHRVQQFDADGTYLAKCGTEGSGDGEFLSPFDIAIRGDTIYVTDRGNDRVQKFALV